MLHSDANLEENTRKVHIPANDLMCFAQHTEFADLNIARRGVLEIY